MRGSRDLDAVELRVLGSLLEKQQSTPEYYPMTLNALVAACNQKTNREPVTSLGDSEITATLSRLQDELLVWKVVGARAVHYDHNLDRRWRLEPAEKAILTLLFLRGPQTPGELRARSERLYTFDSLETVESLLTAMAGGDEPLVVALERRPGQKETRWRHLAAPFSESSAVAPASVAVRAESESGEPLSERVARLETIIEKLETELQELRAQLGET